MINNPISIIVHTAFVASLASCSHRIEAHSSAANSEQVSVTNPGRLLTGPLVASIDVALAADVNAKGHVFLLAPVQALDDTTNYKVGDIVRPFAYTVSIWAGDKCLDIESGQRLLSKSEAFHCSSQVELPEAMSGAGGVRAFDINALPRVEGGWASIANENELEFDVTLR